MRFVPLIVYILVALICTLLPASEGYDSFLWKLLVSQIYAIPSFIGVSFITRKLIK